MVPDAAWGAARAGRFEQARNLIEAFLQAGVVLRAVGDEIESGPGNTTPSTELCVQLESRTKDVFAELSRPLFIARESRAESIRVPDYMRPWWRETNVNHRLANATHIAWRIRGKQGAIRFTHALETAVARHELLRATVVPGNDGIDLVFAPHRTIECLSCFDADEPLCAVEEAVWSKFEAGEVFRPFLRELSSDEVLCGWVLHHYVADFHACQVLAREIYDGLITQNASSEGDRPLQCSEYFRGMAEWERGPALGYRREYWANQMRAAPPLFLPGASEVGAESIGPLQTVQIYLNPGQRATLSGVARSCATTLAMVILAAKFVALSKALGQRDIWVTAVVSGRDAPALRNLVANTADCVPLRLQIRPESAFIDVLTELRMTYALACRYRLKWEMLWETFEAVGASTIAPTFNIVSGMHVKAGGSRAGVAAERLAITPLSLRAPAECGTMSRYLSHEMNLFDTGQFIRGHVKYAPARHDRRAIESFVDVFTRCLARIAVGPGASVRALMD